MMAGEELWSHLLRVAQSDPLQVQTQYRMGSETHRAKLRLWQILALCSHFVHTASLRQSTLPCLMDILTAGNLSSVRMYVEMAVCRILMQNPSEIRSCLFPLLLNYERRHEALPACMLIVFQVHSLTHHVSLPHRCICGCILPRWPCRVKIPKSSEH